VKRLFWLGVGLAAGAYLTRRATEAAQNLTPAGLGANLADGLRELGAGLGAFGAEVRAGMQAREEELTALLERRTGAGVPTLGEALADPPATPAHAWPARNRTAERRVGERRTGSSRAPRAGA
jgi:hypothetical protein